MVRKHLEGSLARVTFRPINRFLEAITGLLQAARREGGGDGRFRSIRMIMFLIADTLDFPRADPDVAVQPARF